MELKTQRSADSSSSSVNKQAKEGAKNFRILKTKSIDVKDQEENELSSNDGSLVPEKQRVAKLVRKKSLGQTSDSSETSVTATAAKIVKPSDSGVDRFVNFGHGFWWYGGYFCQKAGKYLEKLFPKEII